MEKHHGLASTATPQGPGRTASSLPPPVVRRPDPECPDTFFSERPTSPPVAPSPAVPRCSHCRAPAVEHVRYAGVHLCGEHFLDFVKRRVSKEMRKQGGFASGATVGVGVSGGKDSIVVLRLLATILAPRLHPETGGSNPQGDLKLKVLTVDEGIEGYRSHGLKIAAETATELGLPHHVLAVRDMVGATMDDVHLVKGDKNECSFCGVFRRSAINQLARDADCDVVVTGHNLDDTAQAVLMNVTSGEVARLGRMGPHLEARDGLVPRRLPLRWIPEKEVYLTAFLSKWAFDEHECPYAVNSQRFLYRDLLNKMEAASPGTRHSLLRTLEALRPVLPEVAEAAGYAGLSPCSECGEPSSGAVCKTCALGEEVRERMAALPAMAKE